MVGYWLWKSVDGHKWRFVPVPNQSATQTVLALEKGHTYRFLVHAYDAAGNASPAVFGPSFSVSVLEERRPADRLSRPLASWAPGRRVEPRELRGRQGGRAIGVHGARGRLGLAHGPEGGRARVFVDGRYAGTVSLYSPTTTRRVVVFSRSWRAGRGHSIAVHPLGATPGATVDAFVLRSEASAGIASPFGRSMARSTSRSTPL